MLMNGLRKSLYEIKSVWPENIQIKTTLEITNKRLDLNAHLANQSRRIDETNQRIAEVHTDSLARIDVTNQHRVHPASSVVLLAHHDDLIEAIQTVVGHVDAGYQITLRAAPDAAVEQKVEDLASRHAA